MINHFVFVYVNDIMIFYKNQNKHNHHGLQNLLENPLFVNAGKYEFPALSTSVLGYIVAKVSLQMDPGNVSAVTPANNCSCFIHNYSSMVASLTTLKWQGAFLMEPCN